MIDADAEEEDEDAFEPMASSRPHIATGVAVEDGFSVSFVVTGVALNGFARYAGASQSPPPDVGPTTALTPSPHAYPSLPKPSAHHPTHAPMATPA